MTTAIRRTARRLRRLLCRHQCVEYGDMTYGVVHVCEWCGAVFQSYGRLKMHYIGQREEVFDENGKPKL